MRAAALARPETSCLLSHCGAPPVLGKKTLQGQTPPWPLLRFCHVPETDTMGSPLVAANKKSLVLPPSPGWKESISDDANCQKTVYKSWQAAPHGRRRVSMARRPQTCHALSVPQHERASSARRKTSSRSAYDGGRLLRAPVNGVRRRVRGPAAGPKPGLLADFHKTQKPLSPGLSAGSRRRKSQRRAGETQVAVRAP